MLNKGTFLEQVSKLQLIETINTSEFHVQWSKETQVSIHPKQVAIFFHKIAVGAKVDNVDTFKLNLKEIRESIIEYHVEQETAESLSSKLKFLDYLEEFIDSLILI